MQSTFLKINTVGKLSGTKLVEQTCSSPEAVHNMSQLIGMNRSNSFTLCTLFTTKLISSVYLFRIH